MHSYVGRIKLVIVVLKLVIIIVSIFVIKVEGRLVFEVAPIRLVREYILQEVEFNFAPVIIDTVTTIIYFTTTFNPTPQP